MPGFHIPSPPSAKPCDDVKPIPAGYVGPSSTLEVFRKHRYRWEVFGSGYVSGHGDTAFPRNLLVLAWKTVRPSPEFDAITIHNGSEEIYRPGKYRWSPIDISFYEAYQENPEVNQVIYDWWAKSLVNLRNSTYSKPNAYLRSCTLAMLDGTGKSMWKYRLSDCWPAKITPSDLSYADSDLADITVTLRYSKAIEEKAA